jgi:hypothetical protein
MRLAALAWGTLAVLKKRFAISTRVRTARFPIAGRELLTATLTNSSFHIRSLLVHSSKTLKAALPALPPACPTKTQPRGIPTSKLNTTYPSLRRCNIGPRFICDPLCKSSFTVQDRVPWRRTLDREQHRSWSPPSLSRPRGP